MKIKFFILMCCVAGIALFGFSNAKAQTFDFFTMTEGLQEVKSLVGDLLENPVLVAAFTGDNVSDMGVQFNIIWEGDDFGKTNTWSFIFTENGNPTNVIVYIAFKVSGSIMTVPVSINEFPGFSLETPIDETQLVAFEDFLTSLKNNPNFRRASGDTVSTIGVFSLKSN